MLLNYSGFFIYDNFMGDGGKTILFGVLDGHGGAQVMEFVKASFAKVIGKNREFEKYEIIFEALLLEF